jgi:undecaprenyl-diphosphatase
VRSLIRRDFSAPEGRLAWLLVLATIPAALAGALLRDLVSEAFSRPIAVGGFLLVTAALLSASEVRPSGARALTALGWIDSLFIGVAQEKRR